MTEALDVPSSDPSDSIISNHNGVHLINLPPEVDLDIGSAPAWRKLLTEIIESPESTSVVVDMSSVSYLDSTALGDLLAAHMLASQHNKPFVIDLAATKPTGNVRGISKIFEITGLNELFVIITEPNSDKA